MQAQSAQVGTLIHNPTINQQIRNRHIVRDQHGIPLSKLPKKTFVPASIVEAKESIRNDNLIMHLTSYNAAHEKNLEDRTDHKRKILHGEFLCSKAFDNSKGLDWSKKTHKARLTGSLVNASQQRKTLMNTGDKFI